VGQLLLQGYLSLDFGITAYATNTYLKACSSKLAQLCQLLQGGKSVVVTRSGGGGQQVRCAAAVRTVCCSLGLRPLYVLTTWLAVHTEHSVHDCTPQMPCLGRCLV
jgi:hypothetical protein